MKNLKIWSKKITKKGTAFALATTTAFTGIVVSHTKEGAMFPKEEIVAQYKTVEEELYY